MASAEEVLRWAERACLDIVAITDHDDPRGGLLALDTAARIGSPVRVIPGIELTTRGGHLLALFPTALAPPTNIPPLRPLAWTIAAIHALGGVCIVPHPLALIPASAGRRALDRLALADAESRPDGIELANPTPPARWRASVARRGNRRWHFAETGGSDAHFPEQVGSAVTRFPGRTIADLLLALQARTTVAEARTTPSLRDIGAQRLLAQQIRGLSATPRALAARARRRVVHRPQPSQYQCALPTP